MQAQVFKAMGDPARLTMLSRLASGGNHTIGSLSENLGMSRQGARKQLQVLVAAELIELHKAGRETAVTINIEQLQQARAFIRELERQWDQRLSALKAFIEQTDPSSESEN